MQAQTIGALIPIALFTAVVCALGWKMLRLWSKTRERPEFFLGASLALMGLVVAPLAGIGRIPALTSTTFGKLCFGAGMLAVGVAVACLFAFTQATFRRGEGWARLLTALGGLAGLFASAGFARVNFVGANLDEVLAHARPWIYGVIGIYTLCFVWNAVEALRLFAKLRLRLRLGLADPVLVNRFFLWGLASLASVGLSLSMSICNAMEMVIFRDPLPLTLIALLGWVMAPCWYLTFFAPPGYLEWVRRRAAARRAA